MMVRRSALVTLAFAATLAACGGDEPSGGASPTGTASPTSTVKSTVPDACTVLTKAQIQAAIGKDPGEASPQQQVASRSVCTYQGGFSVGVSDGTQFDATISAGVSAGYTYEDVAGVGEKAKWTVVSNAVAQLVVLEGKYMIDLTSGLVADDAAKTKTALVGLMKTAFAKIG